MSKWNDLEFDLEKRVNDRIKYKLDLKIIQEDILKYIEKLSKLYDRIEGLQK